MTSKVFGIGLSRTGTRSLAEALTHLGYRTASFVEHKNTQLGTTTWFAGDFCTDALPDYQAAVDLPIPTFYPQLDECCPGSKFILTVRETQSWLHSVQRHWARWNITEDAEGRYRQMVRLAMYGIHGFSEPRMKHVYETHLRNVQWFFRDRPADLLVVDICAGEGYNKLCPFLGKPCPPAPFPWLNKG